jgi:hypothetical protein
VRDGARGAVLDRADGRDRSGFRHLKNKAHALGANVVHVLTNTTGVASGQYGGSTSSSHLLGVAYRCP